MKVACPFCGSNWDYQGRDKHYGCCPKCKSKVRLHPYVRRGYAERIGRKPVKFPNRNYTFVSNR